MAGTGGESRTAIGQFFFIIPQHIQRSFTALNPIENAGEIPFSFFQLSLKLSVEGSNVMDYQKIALSLRWVRL